MGLCEGTPGHDMPQEKCLIEHVDRDMTLGHSRYADNPSGHARYRRPARQRCALCQRHGVDPRRRLVAWPEGAMRAGPLGRLYFVRVSTQCPRGPRCPRRSACPLPSCSPACWSSSSSGCRRELWAEGQQYYPDTDSTTSVASLEQLRRARRLRDRLVERREHHRGEPDRDRRRHDRRDRHDDGGRGERGIRLG